MPVRIFELLVAVSLYAIAPISLFLHGETQAFFIRAAIVLAVIFGGLSNRFDETRPQVSTIAVEAGSIVYFAAGAAMIFAAIFLREGSPYRLEIISLTVVISALGLIGSYLAAPLSGNKKAPPEVH